MIPKFWLYTSQSLLPDAEVDCSLPRLVARWQESNAASSITGALIFTGSMFAQYVEGPDPALKNLRDVISADDRHVDVHTVDEGSSEKRIFERWKLAYSGHAAPFNRLVLKAHHATPMAGRTLLLEMMRRFTSGA